MVASQPVVQQHTTLSLILTFEGRAALLASSLASILVSERALSLQEAQQDTVSLAKSSAADLPLIRVQRSCRN